MINKLKDICSNGNVKFIFISILILMVLELVYMTNCGLMGIIISLSRKGIFRYKRKWRREWAS